MQNIEYKVCYSVEVVITGFQNSYYQVNTYGRIVPSRPQKKSLTILVKDFFIFIFVLGKILLLNDILMTVTSN